MGAGALAVFALASASALSNDPIGADSKRAAPDTVIDAGPDAVSQDSTAVFEFHGDPIVTDFECSLDGAPFAACTSPATYTGLEVDSHAFEVRAIDPIDGPDLTPASFEWEVGADCHGRTATIVSGSGVQPTTGTAGSDVIVGTIGPDEINGAGGKDVLCAAKGDDVARGGSGKDLLLGAKGDDTLRGQGGDDDIRGGKGADQCSGGAGDDAIATCES